jgi:peptide/nickel transport system permease protein
MNSWYTIRARASGAEVLIYDEIGAYGLSAKGFLAELGALGAAYVILRILARLAGGWIDRAIMALVDVFISLPNLLLLLCGIAVLGTETWVLVVMIGLVRWEGYARIVRGQVLYLRELGYVEASRVLRAGSRHIVLRHILPNLASPLVVVITLNFPAVLLMEAGLSFLGVGVQPPTASLGRMVGDGRDYLVNSWWVAVMPSLLIVYITLMFQVIGDALRDRIDEHTNA